MLKNSKIIGRVFCNHLIPKAPTEDLTLADFKIRELKYTDIRRLIILQKEVYEGVTPWNRTVFLNELNGPFPVLYLVATYESEIVGFAGVRIQRENAHVTNAAIYTAFQKRGLGSHLLKELTVFAKEQQCKTMTLEVRESNDSAIRLYSHFDFTEKKMKPAYYNDGENGILMERRLERD